MNEYKQCMQMLEKLIVESPFAMFTGKNMGPEDYQKLRVWVMSVEERLRALEKDYIARQGDGR